MKLLRRCVKQYGWIVMIGVIGFAVGAVLDPANMKLGAIGVAGVVLIGIFLMAACEHFSKHWYRYV